MIVDAAAGVVTTQPTAEELDRGGAPRRRPGIAPRRAPITDGALADGTPVPLLANLGSPDGAAERRRARAPRASGCSAPSSSSSSVAPGADGRAADASPTRSCSRRSPARRSSSARSTPVPTSRCASSTTPTRRTPRWASGASAPSRASEDILRDQLTALAEAEAATDGRPLGHGADGGDAEETEYFVDIARELRHQDRRGHGRGALARAAGRPLLVDADFAQHRHQRPDAVHARRGPPARLGRRRTRTRGTPRCSAWSASARRRRSIHGKPVGICGEAAADPLLAVVLVGLGATTLSMTPAALADVRLELPKYTIEQARALAAAAIDATTAPGAREAAEAVAAGL